MDMIKAFIGWNKLREWRLRMSVYLGTLAGGTGTDPSLDVLVHTGPDETGRDQASCCSGVMQTM